MIAIEGLYKKLGKRMILKDINIELGEGVYGLLGANGAGKTTLIRCLTGLYRPTKGSIRYEGTPIGASGDYLANIGYVPQAFGMFQELTVYEMLAYFCTLKKVPPCEQPALIDRVLGDVNLTEARDYRVKTLSGGMIRRVGIAQSFLGDAKILYFDEPTSGLDPEERARFKSLLARTRQGKTMLISTHIVEDIASGCDRVIVIHEGSILFNGPCAELSKYAEGKVYEIDSETCDSLGDDCFIVKTLYTNGVIRHRVLSSGPVCADAVPPTLEDGYLSLIKGFGA